MDEIQRHSNHITKALLAAGLDPVLIREFLESQIEVCKWINIFLNEDEEKTEEEFIQNEIAITEVSILSDLLDTDLFDKPYEVEDGGWKKVQEHADELKKVLANANVDARVIKEFIFSQIEVFKEVSIRNRERFSKEELIRNEIKIHQLTLFAKVLA